ncbi:MAG: glycosyltransferase family 2 protein [Pseudomonadota bacterium]
MTDEKDIHALILTLDEAQHIGRCIDSLAGQCASVTVIDSGSQDQTVAIAEAKGAHVVVNPFVNHASQINFGIDHLADHQGWLLRIDADEVLDGDSRQTLRDAVMSASDAVDGLLIQRRIHFLGRRIRHGAIEPSWQLRLWRIGRGRCEQRWMDEHIQVNGQVAETGVVLSDINLNSLTWWTAKHNAYASREAVEILSQRHGLGDHQGTDGDRADTKMSPQAQRRRFVKDKIYERLSPGVRAMAYFLYRYILRLGILDGRAGFYFHLMQALWYRTLVDAKVTEIELHARTHRVTIPDAIKDRVGIDI